VDRAYCVGIRRPVSRLVDAASVRFLIDWRLEALRKPDSLRALDKADFRSA